MTALPSAAQYAPDSDGDDLTDDLDLCFNEVGAAETFGCPPEAFATFLDLDGDGVIDPLDACFSDVGTAQNAGCPDGISPDLDFDMLTDVADRCPRVFGVPENGGCPADADADFVRDAEDACPAQPGTFASLGCPDGVLPPDTDGDSVPDIRDFCPEPGLPDMGGCPDADADGTTDAVDACPGQPGDYNLVGCPAVLTTALLPLVEPITTASAARLVEAGTLTIGQPTFAINGTGGLLVRASQSLIVYAPGGAEAGPAGTPVPVNQAGYAVGFSADGQFAAALDFPLDFSTPPYIEVRRVTGETTARIESPADAAQSVSGLAYSPVAPLLAVAYGGDMRQENTPTAIRFFNAEGNAEQGMIPLIYPAINMAFSADGRRFIHDTAVGGSMAVNVWDVTNPAALLPVTSITAPLGVGQHFIGLPAALNADGSRAVIGYPDGSLTAHTLGADGAVTQDVAVQLFDRDAGEVVSAVAFSPDGSLLAVAGGMPFSGMGMGFEPPPFPVRLIDSRTGVQIGDLGDQGVLVRQMAFTPDGRFLITATGSSVRFWAVGG